MITFDLETTNFSYGSALDERNRIVAVCWQGDDGVLHRAYCYEPGFLAVTPFWEAIDQERVLCAYNKKFEQLWFLRHGIDIDRWKWHDPMLAEKVLLGNVRQPLDLGSVAERYGYDTKDPVIDAMMKAGICPSEMPSKRLLARCARDTRVTHELMQTQLRKMQNRDCLHIYRQRCDFGDILAHIETEGMHLDVDRVQVEYGRTCGSLCVIEGDLHRMTGGINLRSPDQLAHYLYGKLKFKERTGANGKPLRNKPSKQFPDGRPKTDKATLEYLARRADTDEQKEFIKLRQLYGKYNAALTKNLQFFNGVCKERGAHFHAQFNQTVAATHRLTSSGLPVELACYEGKPKSVQFQNMPREFKRLFCAPLKHYVVEVDSSQLEFRVAAFLGQDKQAIQDILDPNFDAHCVSAATMNDIDYGTFINSYRAGCVEYKDMRTAAKADTFKPLYGGTKGTPEQEKWYKAFNERYSAIYATQEGWLADVATNNKLDLPWGMTFSWDTRWNQRGVLLDRTTGRPVRPQVFNYPVQSLATAEIVPIAITCLWKACKRRGLSVKFVNTVHDSVICYVPEDEILEFCELSQIAFTKDVYDYLYIHYGLNFNVPLGCEIKYGKHWGEGTQIVYDDVHNWRDTQ